MISRKMILVVEDNALNRALLCQILAAEYDVLEAENGQAALDLLKQYGEGVSLILLDIVMPVMDGYTFSPPWSKRIVTCPPSPLS